MPFRGDTPPFLKQQFEHPRCAEVQQGGRNQGRPAGPGRGKEVLQRPVEDRQKALGMNCPEKREGQAEQQIKSSSQRRHFISPLRSMPAFF
jgi:hypothetical protein